MGSKKEGLGMLQISILIHFCLPPLVPQKNNNSHYGAIECGQHLCYIYDTELAYLFAVVVVALLFQLFVLLKIEPTASYKCQEKLLPVSYIPRQASNSLFKPIRPQTCKPCSLSLTNGQLGLQACTTKLGFIYFSKSLHNFASLSAAANKELKFRC